MIEVLYFNQSNLLPMLGSFIKGLIMALVNFAWNPVTTDSLGNPVAGPVSYKVYTRPNGGTYTQAAVSSTNSAAVNVAANGNYQAVVSAINPSGESAPSNEVSFVVSSVPAAPTGLVVV